MKNILFSSAWTIVTAMDAPAVEQTAAEELSAFVEKITGEKPLTLQEKDYTPSSGNAILINTKKIAFDASEQYKNTPLGEEGIFYSIEENRIFIGGGSVRGVLYSVYTFLEEELGCHRYTEELEVVPHGKTCELACKTVSFVPPMHYRAASFQDGEAPAYTVFNKLNARTDIDERHGGAVEFGVGFVHTLPTLVPDSLFEEHPEYFPLINGKREHGAWHQRCLTHPDVLAMTIEKVREDFRAHPNHKTASVSQEDTGEESFCCTCPACRRVNEEEGSLMGTQLRFVNAVADAIREEFPDRFIETLAYRFTRHIPKITRPRDNVIIRLCSIECCFSHPIDKCPQGNPAFVKDMRDWAEISKNIYIWDYVTNFAHYLAPQPNLGVLAPNMKFFVEHRTVGMFPEGAPDARGSELSELKSWLLAKLEWDPAFDVKKGIRDFVGAYAGAGAEYILHYIERLTERPAITGSHRNCYAAPDKEFFPEEFMALAEQDFDKAKKAAESQEVLRRIRRWEMSVRYIRLVLYPELYSTQELRAKIAEFVSDMKTLGISKIHEGGSYETSAQVLEERIRQVLPTFSL